jgi:flavin-dependent dehydrogenase
MSATDVLVLGGGPAGCAAAIALTAAGRKVTVLERSRYDGVRLGETLPPEAAPLLHRLGVWEAFARAGHLPSPGIVSVWGGEGPYENDFIFNPYGNGWHLDRRRFDDLLATAVEERGGSVCRAARVLGCSRDASGRWQVAVRAGGHTAHLEASFLVDATGRASWLARRCGARRLVWDRLVGVVGLLPAGGDGDVRTLLEAAEQGWWYSARIPGERLVVAYMTDVDLLPEAPRDLDCFWASHLRQTEHTRRRVGAAAAPGGLRTVAADSYRMDRVTGEGWLAVGDAAMAWDPLSSQGIRKALASGVAAAQAIAGRSEGLEAYAARVAQDFEQYRRLHGHFYGQVRRWRASAFWRRRQQRPENDV